ncbi:MAG: hypothetical protein E7260_02725 [Lachnospiraceae bacterium]|nr:hypothetical protein [Lachnospiraceae bacterium]
MKKEKKQKNEEKRREIRHLIRLCVHIFIIFSVFVFTTYGYLLIGEPWYNATFYAFQTFALNYEPIEVGHWVIYLGRVLCPLATASVLFVLLKDVCRRIRDFYRSRTGATAIYYDNDEVAEICKSFKRPVCMKDKINFWAADHVLMFDKDVDSLAFYERMRPGLSENKNKVYIKLEEMESKLLRANNVYFFNKNEIISRRYWQERHLQKFFLEGKKNVKIAIIGFGSLGEKLLDYALMNNIYSLNQSIEYHIWGDAKLYVEMLDGMDFMNRDRVQWHQTDWKEHWKANVDSSTERVSLADFDRVIVTTEPDLELIQALLYLKPTIEIDYYDPDGAELPSAFAGDRLTAFGRNKDILTEENIKTDVLYRTAKEVNFAYMVNTDTTGTYAWDREDTEEKMQAEWMGLDGFTKGSNIAAADYEVIRKLVLEILNIKPKEMIAQYYETLKAREAGEEAEFEKELEALAEMEHVRWSRYHFVNHWRYKKTEDGKKDKKNRWHPLLVPYDDLDEVEKHKDRVNIIQLFE